MQVVVFLPRGAYNYATEEEKETLNIMELEQILSYCPPKTYVPFCIVELKNISLHFPSMKVIEGMSIFLMSVTKGKLKLKMG